jgi:hypothetical protein
MPREVGRDQTDPKRSTLQAILSKWVKDLGALHYNYDKKRSKRSVALSMSWLGLMIARLRLKTRWPQFLYDTCRNCENTVLLGSYS